MFCAKEVAMIYVDILTSKKENKDFHFLTVGCTQRLPSKNYNVERRETESNCVVDKPDKHYLSQVIKVNINSHEQYLWYLSLI